MKNLIKLGLIALPIAAFAADDANVSWINPTQDIEGNPLTGTSALNKCSIYFGLNPITSTVGNTPVDVPPDPTEHVLTLSGGDNGLTYYIRMTCSNAGGESALSNEVSKFIKKDEVVILAPQPPTLVDDTPPELLPPDRTTLFKYENVTEVLTPPRPATNANGGVYIEWTPTFVPEAGALWNEYPMSIRANNTTNEIIASWNRSSDAFALPGLSFNPGEKNTILLTTEGDTWTLNVNGTIVTGGPSKGLADDPWGSTSINPLGGTINVIELFAF